MAYRRHLATLFRHSQTLLSSNSHSLHPFKSTLLHLHSRILHPQFLHHRNFSSQSNNPRKPRIISEDEPEEDDEEEEETSDEEGEMEEIEERESRIDSIEPSDPGSRSYWVEEKIKEAEEIGYKVMGPIQPSDRVFKSYEPLFAIVQIGSHQFKVSNGDCIYTERLKYCEVNDKLILNKVLLLGSQTQTIVGRPTLPDAAVQAVVEEHALDAKVIIFKKKRRKNYRRTKGHRQELTRLRITEIQGIDMPVNATSLKTEKSTSKRAEKVAVPA